MVKTCAITGGSKGLGKAIKEKLLSEYHEIGCFDYEKEFFGDGEKKKVVYHYEVTDYSRSTGWDLVKNIPKITADILILNAGAWNGDLSLNYVAPREIVLSANAKHIIFILSNAAYKNYGNDDYTTAKAGLLLLARRLQDEGKMVSTISPGTINTGFWEGAEVDNRKRGCMEPGDVADLVVQIIKSAEKGCLITELIVIPRRMK